MVERKGVLPLQRERNNMKTNHLSLSRIVSRRFVAQSGRRQGKLRSLRYRAGFEARVLRRILTRLRVARRARTLAPRTSVLRGLISRRFETAHNRSRSVTLRRVRFLMSRLHPRRVFRRVFRLSAVAVLCVAAVSLAFGKDTSNSGMGRTFASPRHAVRGLHGIRQREMKERELGK